MNLNNSKLAHFFKQETKSRPAWVYQDDYLYLANQANIFRVESTDKLEAWLPPEQEQAYIMPSRYNSFSIGKQAQVLRKETSERFNPLSFWNQLRVFFGDSTQEQLTPSARVLDYGKGRASYRAFKRPGGEYVWLPGGITDIFSGDLEELKARFLFWYMPEKHCVHVFEQQKQRGKTGIDMVAFCSIVTLSDWE